LGTMGRTSSCPEIPKQEIEKILDIPDHKIADRLGTSAYCISYWRRKYGLIKQRNRVLRDIEKLLSEKCLVSSHDYRIRDYLSKLIVLKELAERGYSVLTVKYRKGGSGRYFRFTLPNTIPRYFIYREECENQLVDMLANMIFKRIRIRDQKHIKRFIAIVKEYAKKNSFPEHIADKLASRVEDLLRRNFAETMKSTK